MSVEIEIGKLGNHTDAHGISKGFTPEFFQEVVDSYNPLKFIAPAIISHDTQGIDDGAIASHPELSYGATQSLKVVGDRLKAVFDKVSPKLVDHFRNGELLAVSPSFYPPGHRNNPTPGKWSIRHVAFLGKTPPAIKGLATPQFSEVGFNPSENSLEFSFPVKLSETDSTLCFMIGDLYKRIDEISSSRPTPISYQEEEMTKEDLQENLEYMDEEEEEEEEEDEEEMMEEEPKKKTRFTGKYHKKTTDMNEYLDYSELQSKITELEYQVEEYDRARKLQEVSLLNTTHQLAMERENRKRDRIVSFQEDLVKSGKLLASQVGDRVLSFGEEDEAEMTLTDFMMGLDDQQLAFMEDFLSSHPTQIEYGEFATENKNPSNRASSLDFAVAPGATVSDSSYEEYQEVLNYCEQHNLDPSKSEDFEKAAMAVLG